MDGVALDQVLDGGQVLRGGTSGLAPSRGDSDLHDHAVQVRGAPSKPAWILCPKVVHQAGRCRLERVVRFANAVLIKPSRQLNLIRQGDDRSVSSKLACPIHSGKVSLHPREHEKLADASPAILFPRFGPLSRPIGASLASSNTDSDIAYFRERRHHAKK